MWTDDTPNTTVTFTYKQTDDNGNTTSYVERSLHNENAEGLAKILEEFTYFLHGMTYSYVESVIAQTTNGNEISSLEA